MLVPYTIPNTPLENIPFLLSLSSNKLKLISQKALSRTDLSALRARTCASQSQQSDRSCTTIISFKIRLNPGSTHKFKFETTIPNTLTDRQGFLSSIRSQ
jgi:hypothetical protein